MSTKKQTTFYTALAVGSILLVSLLSLTCLTDFPYVHSDESWLAGLTRSMMEEKSPAATEYFFDAKLRYPHGIKIFFHLLQMAAISVFGYQVFSVRLVSWLAGAGTLWLCYLAGSRLFQSPRKGLFIMALFSVDIQFLYASHFARQEILLSLIQWFCLWNLFSEKGFYNNKTACILGTATGLSIGLHPNSFLLGTMNGLCFLLAYLFTRRKKGALRPLLLYVLITGGFALLFVSFSLMMDNGFLTHYFAYGQKEFGTGAPLWEKLGGFFGFLKRLYQRNSGTYYLPDLRPQFFLFGLSGCLTGAISIFMRKEIPVLVKKASLLAAGCAGVISGMIVIGRYNQTSILFLFPFGYLALVMALELFEGKLKKGLGILLFFTILFLTLIQVLPEIKKTDYEHYRQQIQNLIPENAKVLGNLNIEFFMEYGCLRDYRNLPYALEGEGLLAYLERNEIEYIVYHQELDYLWDHRPYYNVIYGNVMFVEELKNYCQNHCEKVGSFQNSRYGIRVSEILDQEEYGQVTVYRRASSSSSLK